MLKIAFYGKGGIGKSTLASNVSVGFAKLGKKVLHIGCDPKSDSTRLFLNKKQKSILEILEERGNITREEVVLQGKYNVSCMETGGPKAGLGCAGLGISTSMQEIEKIGILVENWDIVVYDVLGDVVCGGFAIPMRKHYVDKVCVVSSADFMSLYAANNILNGIKNYQNARKPLEAILIGNKIDSEEEKEIITTFSKYTGVKIGALIRDSFAFKISDFKGQLIAENEDYREDESEIIKLAEKIINQNFKTDLRPLDDENLEKFRDDICRRMIK